MYEQNYALIRRMETLAGVYRVVSKYINAIGPAIHRLTESDRRLLKALKDQHLMFEEG